MSVSDEFKLSRPLVTVPAAGDQPAKSIDVLQLDLDALTGMDYEKCEREMLSANAQIPVIDPRLNSVFQVQIAAQASGVPVDVLKQMGARDYGRLMDRILTFFVAGG